MLKKADSAVLHYSVFEKEQDLLLQERCMMGDAGLSCDLATSWNLSQQH